MNLADIINNCERHQRDAEEKRVLFNSRPYFRMFINWILDLFGPDPILDDSNFQVRSIIAYKSHSYYFGLCITNTDWVFSRG